VHKFDKISRIDLYLETLDNFIAMRRINLADVPLEGTPPSPNGHFRSSSQNVSIALGRCRNSDSKRETHPFDLELCRVPSGASPCPYHSHSAQSELYLVISGRGKIRVPEGLIELIPGDAVFCPPGEPHQIINDGPDDLVFYIIADDPVGESCYYPDSDKWGLPDNLNGPILKGTAVDYFHGEE
jgi:mannose-6-phosphate isomerase-like protein (cupin superfamily)